MLYRFRDQKKKALSLLYITAGLILVFCSLLTEDAIPLVGEDKAFKLLLSSLLVLGISLATAGAPVATELCVGLCRPVSEENIGNLRRRRY